MSPAGLSAVTAKAHESCKSNTSSEFLRRVHPVRHNSLLSLLVKISPGLRVNPDTMEVRQVVHFAANTTKDTLPPYQYHHLS